MSSMQCNGTFAYRHGTFYRTEENHGTVWLSWTVAEPCTRALTSKEQSAAKGRDRQRQSLLVLLFYVYKCIDVIDTGCHAFPFDE
jgi:hypothetical protein